MAAAMTSNATPQTRSKMQVWLIGSVSTGITQSHKLPSLRETLSVFFHHHKEDKLTLKESSEQTVKEVLKCWVKAGIPTARSYDITSRLLKVHAEWQGLKKAINRRTDKQISNEQDFSSRLDSIFDIAHQDAERLIKIPEDWEFLVAQREGRKGYMAGEDKVFAKKAEQKVSRLESEKKRSEKSKTQIAELFSTEELEFSSSESDGSSGSTTDTNVDESDNQLALSPKIKRKRHRKNVTSSLVTKHVAMALDRTKVTDREAPHLLAATAHALGHGIEDLPLSRSSIRRARLQHREAGSTDIKLRFAPETPLVVHWDGKLLPDLTGKEKVDRLAVIVSGAGVEQLLGVPKLASSTGDAQATAVLRCIDDWNLGLKVKGMCFDTTASNSGIHSGACVLIQQALNRNLLPLACRHHILEIVVEKAFTAMKIAPSTGPDILIFRRFQEQWQYFDRSNYQTAASMEDISSFKERIIEFAQSNLEAQHPRDDYKELLELVIIFVGREPPRGIHFLAPGALHRARWMARILYSFKMWMFRTQFKLKAVEERGILQFLLFVSEIYIQAWFEAPSPVSAPANDLQFLQQLTRYRNQEISNATTVAFKRHLWYLSDILVGLAFFDPAVGIQEKIQMVQNREEQQGSKQPLPRLQSVVVDNPLRSFVTTNTRDFFKILGLKESFLSLPPSLWQDNDDYMASERIVLGLRVVNDAAERGVKLIQDCNSILTYDEEQKQFLLQIVEEHRSLYPDSKKKTILAGQLAVTAD
jgi:hypothetical protein